MEDTTQNNIIWNEIFKKNKILDEINKKGFYEITADTIKEAGREPRLMAKYDSSSQLPKIFNDNKLGILPIKRGNYIIGKFNNYKKIAIDENVDVETVFLPDYINTIYYKNITVEAVALNAALISGMLNEIAGEEVLPTVSGRMGTGKFNYKIDTIDGKTILVDVEKSQMEIDGSYEGKSKFIIVEAKRNYIEDFIIRQLYYPYRVWKKATPKEIIPVLLILHDNVFNFFIYSFKDEDYYNSIELVKVKRFILEETYDPIEFSDITNVMSNIVFKEEIGKFPQANTFNLVLDLLRQLYSKDMSREDITDFIGYAERQSDYYIDAEIYLGFAEKKEKKYVISEYGKRLLEMNHRNRTLEIIKNILSHKSFYVAMKQIIDNNDFNVEEIAKYICDSRVELNIETAKRRTSTVISWIKWIVSITTYFDYRDF